MQEGKGGENFRKKKFRCKVKREERSLQQLKKSVWYKVAIWKGGEVQ